MTDKGEIRRQGTLGVRVLVNLRLSIPQQTQSTTSIKTIIIQHPPPPTLNSIYQNK